MTNTTKGLNRNYIDEVKELLNGPNAKEIHFYEYEPKNLDEIGTVKHSWYDTEHAINIGAAHINTTQMGLLDTRLWRLGYRIYIHSNINNTPIVNELVYGKMSQQFEKRMTFQRSLFREWLQWFVMQFEKV